MVYDDPAGINAQFARFYESLYTSRADFTPDSLHNFLDHIEFPQLSDEARNTIDDQRGTACGGDTPKRQNSRTQRPSV